MSKALTSVAFVSKGHRCVFSVYEQMPRENVIRTAAGFFFFLHHLAFTMPKAAAYQRNILVVEIFSIARLAICKCSERERAVAYLCNVLKREPHGNNGAATLARIQLM